MTDPLRIPPGLRRWSLKSVRTPASLLGTAVGSPDAEGLVAIDLTVADGRIAGLAPASDAPDTLPSFWAPGLVVPAFVDVHTHLDKGHIAPRAPSPGGTFAEALALVPQDRETHWTAPDVAARMHFAVAAAYSYGTRAIRTHLDCKDAQTRISYEAFAGVRDAWRGRVELQASPLFPIDLALDDAHMAEIKTAIRTHGGCLGAFLHRSPVLQPGLDRLFKLAADSGWDLDFHVDETEDATSNVLLTLAETAIAQRFAGRILAGHCCTLALLPEAERARTVEAVARAGISVVSLPLCNLYLMDRAAGRTPRWRGITALHELAAAGVPVTIASDNTRDPFHAYGDLDMTEVWRVGTRIAHLDHPFGHWPRAVFRDTAAMIGLGDAPPLAVGRPADLVVFPARSLSEFMARPTMGRTVIRAGQAITADPPAYAALDHLEGLRP